MNLFVDSTIMKQIDKDTINEVGIESLVLMERAALKVAENIKLRENINSRIVAICGVGNNGGDGVCVARILHNEGYNVSIYMIGNLKNCSIETSRQIDIARKCGVVFINEIDLCEYDIIIDAIFGIGLSRSVEGEYYKLINDINDAKLNVESKIYSIDIPSGINTDNGRVENIAINADFTITFGVNKKGLILYPGRGYAGEVIVEDIGFPMHIINKNSNKEGHSVFNAFTKDNYKKYIPLRKPNSNKGTYGKVLVIAGSKDMAGACYFSVKAAYRMGTGLVQAFTCEDNRDIIMELVPEAIMTTYSILDTKESIIKKLDKALAWCDVVIIGPGLGISDLSLRIVEYVVSSCDKTKVIDADALNIISNINTNNIRNAIFTPHMKEMSRLLDCDVIDIQQKQNNPELIYKELINKYINMKDISLTNNMIENKVMTDKCIADDGSLDFKNNVLVLKDATTLITNGHSTYVNTSGNNGLATAGSGDVLTGIIAGLLSQGLDNITSAALGVYLHGLAAENYTERFNTYSLNASDLIEAIQYIL